MTKQHNSIVEVALYENETNSPRKKIKTEAPLFGFIEGSHAALSSNYSSNMAFYQTKATGCSPLAMHLKYHGMPARYSFHSLVHDDRLLDLLEKIPFQDKHYSEQLDCVLQLHTGSNTTSMKDAAAISSPNLAFIEKSIALSKIPGIGTTEYVKPSQQLVDALKSDFRLWPNLLHAVAMLHTGCLVTNGHDILITLTAEAYSRSKALDVHAETNLKTIPSPGSAIDGLSLGVYEEADGGPVKKKLKIGSDHMNVLITMSAMIKTNEVFIGPETPLTDIESEMIIFYDAAKEKKFLEILRGEQELAMPSYKCPKSVSALRQLSSSFGKASTYSAWRATLNGLDTDLLQPATVFTIADIPGNQKYGISENCTVKAASSALQAVAIAVMTSRSLESKTIMTAILQSASNSSDASIVALMIHLSTRITTDPFDLARFLSPLAKVTSSALSSANQKIKSNVQIKLLQMFGH
ncbi:hypothetical protein DM01DRAFT_1068896 [Hesseltinella vesiculosa]|uniref:Uncharacterized protein n=1 Tax=Hesseltinella vesiculosa TaxID=101127 RepID=A0A1X2GV99_9FUNG|nr:hypothetical protein DM01DRAFT_1068896 [Hesseltinella vesiculosa]